MPLRRLHQKSQSGFTLLEILIAAILLTGGLVGLASMQVNGTRLNNSAYLRSQANALAYDIVDRMRANLVDARAGNYDLAMADATPALSGNVEDIDLVQWRTNLAYYLPAGSGAITRVAGPTADDQARFTITVRWNDGRAAADVIDFVLVTDL